MTIVAPMTPSGVSAVAALRVSGSMTKAVMEGLFKSVKISPRKANYGVARDKDGRYIDALLYVFFEGPASYTGEDTLELFPHGNPLIVRDLLKTILTFQGVRLALPGEFTKRAFLNGKLDLVQAASVGDVIHSTSKSALDNAKKMLSGKLSKEVKTLSAMVLDFSARVELDVDFAEEEADPDISGWKEKLENMKTSVKRLLSKFKSQESINKLPLVVVYGAPNAGKSSLINALLEEDRLLVSNVAGTTRDFVEVRLMLPRGEIRLVDTAGLSDVPVSELDALSMAKSKEVLLHADFKIHVIEHTDEIKTVNNENEIVVISKSDLLKDIPENIENTLFLSSKTGYGLAQLKEILNEKTYPQTLQETEDFWVTSEREKACLENALAGLLRVEDLLNTTCAVELIAFEMQTVRHALQSITGEISSEDVLQSIFSGFCIGK